MSLEQSLPSGAHRKAWFFRIKLDDELLLLKKHTGAILETFTGVQIKTI